MLRAMWEWANPPRKRVTQCGGIGKFPCNLEPHKIGTVGRGVLYCDGKKRKK